MGMEKDEYDEKDAYYIVYKDKQGIIRGCQRLIEMTNPCMFDGPFKFLLSDLKDFKRSGYWEVSRFAVDYDYDASYTQAAARKVSLSILAGALYFARELQGIEAYLSLAFPSITKLYESYGIVGAQLKKAVFEGNELIVSCYFPLKYSYEKVIRRLDHNPAEPFLYYTGPMYASGYSEFKSTEPKYKGKISYL